MFAIIKICGRFLEITVSNGGMDSFTLEIGHQFVVIRPHAKGFSQIPQARHRNYELATGVAVTVLLSVSILSSIGPKLVCHK